MRPLTIALAAALTLAAAPALAGCGDDESEVEVSDEFCEAARELDAEIAGTEQDPEAQRELVAPLAEEAPPEIREDAELWLDALRRVAAGDESVVDDPEVEEAVDNVNRVAQNGCDLLGGGSSPFG